MIKKIVSSVFFTTFLFILNAQAMFNDDPFLKELYEQQEKHLKYGAALKVYFNEEKKDSTFRVKFGFMMLVMGYIDSHKDAIPDALKSDLPSLEVLGETVVEGLYTRLFSAPSVEGDHNTQRSEKLLYLMQSLEEEFLEAIYSPLLLLREKLLTNLIDKFCNDYIAVDYIAVDSIAVDPQKRFIKRDLPSFSDLSDQAKQDVVVIHSLITKIDPNETISLEDLYTNLIATLKSKAKTWRGDKEAKQNSSISLQTLKQEIEGDFVFQGKNGACLAFFDEKDGNDCPWNVSSGQEVSVACLIQFEIGKGTPSFAFDWYEEENNLKGSSESKLSAEKNLITAVVPARVTGVGLKFFNAGFQSAAYSIKDIIFSIKNKKE